MDNTHFEKPFTNTNTNNNTNIIVNRFTVYSKSGCPNCLKVKTFLKDQKCDYKIVDCDEYLILERESFLLFIKDISGKSVTQFPIVFSNEVFIGGYTETKLFIERDVEKETTQNLIFDDNF